MITKTAVRRVLTKSKLRRWLQKNAKRYFACKEAESCPIAKYLSAVLPLAKGSKWTVLPTYVELNSHNGRLCITNQEWVCDFIRAVDAKKI